MQATSVGTPGVINEETIAYQRRWYALVILSLALAIIVIDTTIVNIAFPAIRKTFNASFADAEWVNSIYSLVFGAALITWGKLGDQYGRRNIFVVGAVVFVAGSLGSGLAPSIPLLIAARAVQGMGGAMMSPSTLSIVSATFKGKERGLAFGLWGATTAVAATLGPIMGGWLIQYGASTMPDSWRLAFLINVPIGLVAIVGSFWAMREIRDTTIHHHIDWWGIVLASSSVGALVFGAIEGQNFGWLHAKKVFVLGPLTYPALPSGAETIPANTLSFIPFIFLIGAVLFALFVLVEMQQERRGQEPLFEFGMLRYRSFRYGLLTVLIVALGEFGIVLSVSIFFQLAKNFDTFQTGVHILPFAGAVIVAAPLAGMFSSRFGAKWVVTTGMALEAVALFMMSRMLYVETPYWELTIPFIIYGAGVGLAIAQLSNIVLSDIPTDKVGISSAANNTLRQFGASLGVAIIGAVLFSSFATATKPLIDQTTAFDDFGKRVAANGSLSREAKLLGTEFAALSAQAKQFINKALDNNEADSGADYLATAITLVKQQPIIVRLLKIQGVDVTDDVMVRRVKTELQPDVNILSSQIQGILGTGFATAGRMSAVVAGLFVSCGAISSLMLPNSRNRPVAAALAA